MSTGGSCLSSFFPSSDRTWRDWRSRTVAGRPGCDECRAALAVVLPLRDEEVAFIAGVRDQGLIRPELLTNDEQLRERIRVLPGLAWRIQQRTGRTEGPINVRASPN